MIARAALLDEAERWIGTPYCHQASVRGAGADCMGLIIGVWRGVGCAVPDLSITYTRQWAEHAEGEPLLAGLEAHLIPVERPRPGDLILLRWRPHMPASHLAFLARHNTIIHAYEGGAVSRSPLGPWRRLVAASFALPGVD